MQTQPQDILLFPRQGGSAPATGTLEAAGGGVVGELSLEKYLNCLDFETHTLLTYLNTK